MNKKILMVTVTMLAVVMLATPLVGAKPAAEKNNDKFEFFQLVVSGATSDIFDRMWTTPPDTEPIKTSHGRGGGWITGEIVELTVGSVTYTKITSPVRIDYSTTYNYNSVFKDGAPVVKINLHDIVTVYVNDEPIGTIELKINAMGGPTVGYSGIVNGYGTGAFKHVHISAIDLGPPLPTRVGTITGFPELPPLV